MRNTPTNQVQPHVSTWKNHSDSGSHWRWNMTQNHSNSGSHWIWNVNKNYFRCGSHCKHLGEERERPGNDGRNGTSQKKLGHHIPRISPSWILALQSHLPIVTSFSFAFFFSFIFHSTPGISFESRQLPNISKGKMTSWTSTTEVNIWEIRKQVKIQKNMGFPNMGRLENCRRESSGRETRVEEIFPCLGRQAKIWKIFLQQVGGCGRWVHFERDMERKDSERRSWWFLWLSIERVFGSTWEKIVWWSSYQNKRREFSEPPILLLEDKEACDGENVSIHNIIDATLSWIIKVYYACIGFCK